MLEHDSAPTQKEIKKLPKHFKFFHQETFIPRYKKRLIRLFRIRIDKKITELGESFIALTQYDKPIFKYNKTEIYKEIKALEVGTENWYNALSPKARRYIASVDNLLFNQDFDMAFSFDHMDRYVNNYERIIEFAETNNRDDLLTDDGKALKDDVIINNVFLQEQLGPDYYSIYYRLLDYAFNYDKSMLNDDQSDLSLKTITDYIFLNNPIPTPIIKNMKDSTKRTYDLVTDYAMCNMDKFQYFVTLTFAIKKNEQQYIKNNLNRKEHEYDLQFIFLDNPSDYTDANKKKTQFLNDLKKKLKKDDIDLFYLGVPEHHVNGNIHFHFLMSDIPDNHLYEVPEWLDVDYKTYERRHDKGFKNWKYGKSTVEKIKDKNRISSYIGKYLMKSVGNLNETEYLERLNKQRFFKSRNLIKPEVTINDDYTEEYDDIYYSEYKNVYNDSLTGKIIFTLND